MQSSRLFHHREDRRGHQDVHAGGCGQARRENHARRPARADNGFPSRRSIDRDDHHVQAAACHDGEGSTGDSREELASSRSRTGDVSKSGRRWRWGRLRRRSRRRGRVSSPLSGDAKTLPKTASRWLAIGLASVLLLAIGCALTPQAPVRQLAAIYRNPGRARASIRSVTADLVGLLKTSAGAK